MFIFCDKCGAKNNDTAVFCRECGNSLALKDDEEVKDSSSEEKKEDTKEETVSTENPSEETTSEEKKEETPTEEKPLEEKIEEEYEDEDEDDEPVTEVLYDPNKTKEEPSEDGNNYEDEDKDEESNSSEKQECPVEEEYEDEDEDDDKKVENFPQLDELNNPSTDTYWDDVIPEIEEEIYQIPKDIIIKGVVGAAILIIFIVMLIVMI